MGVASVIHNGVRIPVRFNSGLRTRLSPAPNWSRAAHSFHHHHLRTGGGGYGRRSVPIVCSRATEQDDDVSTSVEEQSYDGVTNVDGSDVDKSKGAEAYATSVRTVSFSVCAAVLFGVAVGFKEGVGKATEFFAGYLLEQSLSVDNLFVFVLIFKYFKVPPTYQGRVLSYGIAGAIIFRLTLILLGTVTLQKFEAVNLFLAAILLYSSFKLFTSEDDDSDLSDNFVVKTCQKFIPVTDSYDGDQFFTIQEGVRKVSNILGRPHLCF